jgi:superfamily II DNA or RNA helicase
LTLDTSRTTGKLLYTLADVQRIFSAGEIAKGQAYFRDGLVLAVEIGADGTVLRGQVQGTLRRPYTATVHIQPQGGYGRSRYGTGTLLAGSCSCPVGYNCKHTVALLLAALAQYQAAPAKREESPEAPLAAWLTTLDQATAASEQDSYPDTVRRRVLYVLNVEPVEKYGNCLTVEAMSVQLLRNGGVSSKASTVSAGNMVNTGFQPAYLQQSDLFVLRSLWAQYGPYFAETKYPLVGDTGQDLLERILRTGRGRWQRADGLALVSGPPRSGQPTWVTDSDGTQHLTFALNEVADVTLPLAPPWYLDTLTGACGPIETDLSPRLAAALVSAPPVPPGQADWLRRELARRLPDRPALQPTAFGETVVMDVEPVPCLHIAFRQLDDEMFYASSLDDPDGVLGEDLYGDEPWSAGAPVARLGFDYDGTLVDPDDPRDELTAVEGGQLVVIPRQRDDETSAVERLGACGFRPVDSITIDGMSVGEPGDLVLVPENEDLHWLTGPLGPILNFLHHEAPALRAEGWRIVIDEDFPLRLAEPGEDWIAEVAEGGSGIDWFGLSLGITVAGERIDLVPVLLPLLRALPEDGDLSLLDDLGEAGQTLFAPLTDGRVLPLPVERVRPLLAALYDLYRVGGIDEDGKIRLSAARLAELAELEAAAAATNLRWLGGSRLLETGRKLREIGDVAPVPPPNGLKADLRPYQQQGLNWLQFLREVGLGGILADDMGLGKTVQALAHVLAEKEAGRLDRPCLVVAPTSLMANWRREAARFAPGLSVLTLHGAGRKAEFNRMGEHDLVLTTYPLLSRDKDALLSQEWHIVLLDEAQAIKNPKAQATLAALQLQARHRVCLTGTPMENNLEELWSLFHFLSPGLLGDQRQFKRVFRTPIEKQGDEDRRRLLGRRVRPFLLRRTKAEVAAELPEKTEIVETVDLDDPQRDLYESIRVAMDAKVRAEIASKGLARSHIMILDALLKLRQACCDPRLLKVEGASKVKSSAKLERLMDMLPELVAEGRRVLLFSQFTSMLSLIEESLRRTGIDYVKLTGQTRDRKTPVDRFQAGEVPVFLISLKAGGTGLNLTAADTVILYDPWWNPAVERQAMDRAHRIGQDKAVFVFKLVTAGTVEEAILTLQARKQALADGLFDPEAETGAMLTSEDIDLLFQPIERV